MWVWVGCTARGGASLRSIIEASKSSAKIALGGTLPPTVNLKKSIGLSMSDISRQQTPRSRMIATENWFYNQEHIFLTTEPFNFFYGGQMTLLFLLIFSSVTLLTYVSSEKTRFWNWVHSLKNKTGQITKKSLSDLF